ncbi:MAG: cation transporter dimerization domain-containing protein [Candidatus Nanopelagicales bacterium]
MAFSTRPLPKEENELIAAILGEYQSDDIKFHALQTRESGRHRFVSMHVLVPGAWSVAQDHDLVEKIELRIRDALPDTTVSTHVEPIEDPRSWEDQPRRPPHRRRPVDRRLNRLRSGMAS